MRRNLALLFVAAITATSLLSTARGEGLDIDLRQAASQSGWRALHDLVPVESSPEGLRLRSTGDDPYCESPVLNPPVGTPLILTLRARSATGGPMQVFFYADRGGAKEADSVRLLLPAGEWHDISTVLPPLPARTRLRIDPPAGTTDLARLTIESRLTLDPPPWPKPDFTPLPASNPTIRSGRGFLRHARDRWNAIDLGLDTLRPEDRSAGLHLAAGHPEMRLAYGKGNEVRWVRLETAECRVTQFEDRIESLARLADLDGGIWNLRQSFSPGPRPGAFSVEAAIECDQDRDLFFAPLLVVCPGAGTTGEAKRQGLLAGVEYLDDEPSSSTADIAGPLHERRVPIRTKLTFPLMTVQHADAFAALTWEQSAAIAPLFDSPDRTFQSGAHVMGLIAPGTDLNFRSDGAVYPFRPQPLPAGKSVSVRATLFVGEGDSVIPAVKEYVALRGLPELPGSDNLQDYVRLAARGWLDSPIREGARFRHALPADRFAAHPASDAAWMMEQLATLTDDAALRQRLTTTAADAWKVVDPRNVDAQRVGHTALPVGSLLRPDLEANLDAARQRARGLLGRFAGEGKILYQPRPEVDYGKTHWSKEANGLEAQVVAQLLEDAAFCGDRELIRLAIERLRGLDRFRNTVPRGAQTWEVPLHTPDILAASHLVRAYVLGYELSGDRNLLDSARDWAWTGVPFVYLVNPTEQPVGPYATIAVLGATNWEAPLWIGLPVQWCGLCYADALLRLARHDADGPWTKLAQGIGRSGIQQVYPADHPSGGLLPDSFTLEIQHRNIFDINPGTLHPVAIAALTGARPYDFATVDGGRILVHAAGQLRDVIDTGTTLKFEVMPWSPSQSTVLIHSIGTVSEVRRNGELVPEAERRVVAETGSLLLTIDGRSMIEVDHTAEKGSR